MSIFGIGDLHLSLYKEKPMDIFGPQWKDHTEKIQEAWNRTVSSGDTVVLNGDLSWAMDEIEVVPDLSFIHGLPGQKIIMKGNHEYWWSTVRKVSTLLEDRNFCSIRLLYNSAIYIEESCISICGTRGWKCPANDADGGLCSDFSQQDLKIYKREVQRLEMSLREGKKYSDRLLVFMHFPPFNHRQEPSDFTELLESYEAEACFYGHLHGPSHRYALCGRLPGGKTIYRLISADYIDFTPYKVL